MRRACLVSIALVLHPGVVAAETTIANVTAPNASPPASSRRPDTASELDTGRGDVAIGVNLPTSWLGLAFGASVYVGLSKHDAIRVNLAHFRVDNSVWPITLVASGFYDSDPFGSIWDVGVSWVWYSRRLQDGLMIEAGVLRRQRDTSYWPEMSPRTETDTTAYAGRAMIGWSWRVARRGFISAAVGASTGYESGIETITDDDYPMRTVTTRPVQRNRTDIETYVRWGIGL